MSGSSYSASSTFTGGRGSRPGFASTVASKVLDAAKLAKTEKKKQEQLLKQGYEIPESQQKGLFAKALKDQFISKPYRDFAKDWNKKVGNKAEFVGLFSKRGESFANKFKMKGGKNFSQQFNYTPPKKDEEGGGGSGGSGGLGVNSLGGIVLDIQMIANSMSGLASIFNTQLGIIYKISGSLAEIKKILSDQIDIQQSEIDLKEEQAKEGSLEQQGISGTSNAAESTFTPLDKGDKKDSGGLSNLLGGNILGLLKNPMTWMFMGGAVLAGLNIFGAFKGKQTIAEMNGKKVTDKAEDDVKKAVKSKNMWELKKALDWHDKVSGNEFLQQGLSSNPSNFASGGVNAMIGEAGPEVVSSLTSSKGKQNFGDGDKMGEVYQQPYNAVAGSMLAVTKDFVEALGPVGQSVAPVVQEDIGRLGRVFKMPPTDTKISVGGASLARNPMAEKQGKKYLEDLVMGSLKKLKPESKKKSSGGGSGGSGGSNTTPPDTTTTPAAPAGAGSPAPAAQQTPTVTATSFSTAQLKSGKNDNLQKVGGGNPGKYRYDGMGNIYAVDKDERRILTKDEIKNGVPGAAGNFNFFRNLNSGVVNLTTHGDAKDSGWYDYAANAVREPVKGHRGTTSQRWVPVNESTKFKDQFTEATPYGKSTFKAESGIKAVLTLGGERMSNIPVSSFAGTHSHHGTGKGESNGRGGVKRDYLLQKPNAIDGVLAGPSHKGAPVPAGMDGYAEVANDEFNTVLIWNKPSTDPSRKLRAKFLHFDSVRVKTGDRVNPGTILGGQGNKPNYEAYHVHLEASAKDQDQWIKTVSAMIAGGQLPSDSGNPDDPGVSPTDNPFDAMQNMITSLSASLGASAVANTGEIKSRESYNSVLGDLTTKASQASSAYKPAAAPAARPASVPMGASATNPTAAPSIVVMPGIGAASQGSSIPVTQPSTPMGVSSQGGSAQAPGYAVSIQPRSLTDILGA